MPQAHIFVTGKVQGVYYRQSTKDKATSLGLVGWTRNLPDRRVEILAQGPPEALEALIQWCWQGPPMATVTDVTTTHTPTTASALTEFQILR